MPPTKACVQRKVPVALTVITWFQSSSFIRPSGVEKAMPALLTRISTVPALSASASMLAGLPTSQTAPEAW